MDRETLLMFKKDVRDDYLNRSTRLYQSIRALSEYLMKESLVFLGEPDKLADKHFAISDLTKKLQSYYQVQFNFDDFYSLIIRPRNMREHNPESAPKIIDHRQMKLMIFCYNDLVNALLNKTDPTIYGSSLIDFKIDEKLFHEISPLTFINSTKQSVSQGAQLELNRLRKKLAVQLQSASQYTDTNNYSVRSEIITLKNNMKRNEVLLLPDYLKNGPAPKIRYVSAKTEVVFAIGLTERDPGFCIKGVSESCICSHPDRAIYAILFELLKMNRISCPSHYLSQIEQEKRVKLNHATILRFKFIILLMIQNNYVARDISVCLQEGQEDFLYAFSDLTTHARMIADLANIHYEAPRVKIDPRGISIALNSGQGARIFCEDLVVKPLISHSMVWHENRLLYDIHEGNRQHLNQLLKDFLHLETFKPGQIHVLERILNQIDSGIVIMPTSAGKSLIYYFTAMLSSLPSIIVLPTRILIADQIRMLKNKHWVDYCQELETDFDYTNMDFNCKFNFVSPEIFMNRSFTTRISALYSQGKIASIVIDEVHCASNWSHDYRPAYLMLTHYIHNYLSGIQTLGLTATTNYKVTKDLMRQLKIQPEQIQEPIDLKRDDVVINFQLFSNDNDIHQKLAQQLVNQKSRAMVFTKNGRISREVHHSLQQQGIARCDVFSNHSSDSYDDFVSGYTDVLITDYTIGIGLNFPKVESSYHIGYPLSRNAFIQEAGRVGREGAGGQACIFAHSQSSLQNFEKKLLTYNLPVNEIIEAIGIFHESSSDIINSYASIMGHLENHEEFQTNAKSLYHSIATIESKSTRVLNFDYSDMYQIRQQNQNYMQNYLIMMKNIGIIDDWFIEGKGDEGTYYEVIVSDARQNTAEVKTAAIRFLRQMECDQAIILKFKVCENVEQIIDEYVNWYYYGYTLHHREQFLNMINMIAFHTGESNVKSDIHIEKDFRLGIMQIEKTIQQVAEMDISAIAKNIGQYMNQEMINIISSIIEDTYDVKYDLILLFHDAKSNSVAFQSRLQRIFSSQFQSNKEYILAICPDILRYCQDENRLILLDVIIEQFGSSVYLERLYEALPIDSAYINMLCILLNRKLRSKQ